MLAVEEERDFCAIKSGTFAGFGEKQRAANQCRLERTENDHHTYHANRVRPGG